MRKTYLPLSFACLLSLFLLSAVKAGKNTAEPVASVATVSTPASSSTTALTEDAAAMATANMIYDSLQLKEIGLSKEAMQYAYKGFQKLVKKGQVENSDILTICDFSQPSSKKRLYILDISNMKVLVNTYVAHGKNSGLRYAERFSNRIESLQSSLGFYVTKNTYIGKHGLSLRLSGKDKGFNDNAERRAVVVHGANYIGPNRASAPYQGRSFGCPAVPQAISSRVINLIKDGTCLFVYHPSKSYLHGSSILNG